MEDRQSLPCHAWSHLSRNNWLLPIFVQGTSGILLYYLARNDYTIYLLSMYGHQYV